MMEIEELQHRRRDERVVVLRRCGAMVVALESRRKDDR